jgi:hypothetical protein
LHTELQLDICPTFDAPTTYKPAWSSQAIGIGAGKQRKTCPLITLPFEHHRLAASAHTLRLAQLLPADETQQQLLMTVIALAEEMRTHVLTVPAAVILAGCALRMASYLIESAAQAGTTLKRRMIPCR